MQIVVTMAGLGSRFTKAGYASPKHEIEVRGRTLFEWALRSLSDFKNDAFFFVVRKGAYDQARLKRLIAAAEIKTYQLVVLDTVTSGQAATVMAAMPDLDPEAGLVIYNIDTYVEPGYILRRDLVNCAGHLTTFKAAGDHWSFVQLDDQNRVIDVVEKRRVSDLASVGFYYFGRSTDFAHLYRQHAQEVVAEYGETYVAPFYHYLIRSAEAPVTVKTIPTAAVHVLGTPEELLVFQQAGEKSGQD